MGNITKRIISATIAFSMLVASTAILPAGADSGSMTIEYYKYDLQLQGNEVRFNEYSLSINQRNMNSRSEIGGVTPPDERVPDTNSSVVRVKMYQVDPYGESKYINAAGFIVDAHTIATAAHVVYRPSTAGAAYGVEHGYVIVYDEELGKNVQHAITEVHIPKAYTTVGSHDNDYALVTVDADLTQYGFFELGCINNNLTETDEIPLSVSGFPEKLLDENGEIIKNTNYQLYTGRGTLVQTWDNRIFYDNDASGGNSGGPVYVTTRYTMDGTNWEEYNTVVGICTGSGYLTPGSWVSTNDARRITEPLLQFYLNNSNIDY